MLKNGRLASVFCALASEGFTGVLRVEHASAGGAFYFRDGLATFVEDRTGPTLADLVLKNGLLTRSQHARVAEAAQPGPGETAELAFCRLAVDHGLLEQHEVDGLIAQRSRGRIIQAMGWHGSKLEIDEDPRALAGLMEVPQDVGPMVYVGVRTFFDFEQIEDVLGAAAAYAQLSVPVGAAARFLELGREEVALLRALAPERQIEDVLEQLGHDPLEGWQLIATLAMAGMVDVGPAPFDTAAPRGAGRGVRAGAARGAGLGARTAGRGASGPGHPRDVPARGAPAAAADEPSPSDAAPRKRPRVPKALLKQLGRELKDRGMSTPQERADGAGAAQGTGAPPGGRANVKALVRMRMASRVSQQVAQEAADASASEALETAHSLLRAQQYAQAHDAFEKLLAAQPEDVRLQAYTRYAAMRARRTTDTQRDELRKLIRQFTGDEEMKGFAALVLGHIALEEREDHQAEKFFRKSVEIEQNKDAERHLRILELKRRTAEQGKGSNKLFGLAIGRKKP